MEPQRSKQRVEVEKESSKLVKSAALHKTNEIVEQKEECSEEGLVIHVMNGLE